jgi:hypothetical protein
MEAPAQPCAGGRGIGAADVEAAASWRRGETTTKIKNGEGRRGARIYRGATFSPGWSHEPGLKDQANFGWP